MKKLLLFIVAGFLSIPVFSQNNFGIPPAKRQKPVPHEKPANNPDYGKNATKASKKDMDKSIDKFQDPKYKDAVKGKKAKKAPKAKGT